MQKFRTQIKNTLKKEGKAFFAEAIDQLFGSWSPHHKPKKKKQRNYKPYKRSYIKKKKG